MKVLIIFNREPYDNTDVTWNGLRLANGVKRSNGSDQAKAFNRLFLCE